MNQFYIYEEKFIFIYLMNQFSWLFLDCHMHIIQSNSIRLTLLFHLHNVSKIDHMIDFFIFGLQYAYNSIKFNPTRSSSPIPELPPACNILKFVI